MRDILFPFRIVVGACAALLLSASLIVFAHVIEHEHPPEPAPVAEEDIDLQEFEARCRRLLPLMFASWKMHNADAIQFYPAFVWQIILESSCRPDIANAIDAVGLGQILKTAASDCHGAGIHGSRREAVFNLECSSFLMARTGRIFRSERTGECRAVLKWIGHLSGAGWLIKSQKIAQANGDLAMCWWDGIGASMEKVISKKNADHAWDYAGFIAHRSGIADDKIPRGSLGIK